MDLLAAATFLVAIFTAVLAYSTFVVARSSTADQQSQWRPVVIPGDQTVDESTEGEAAIELRNVGRGPAMGLHGELRRGDQPYAASIPGQENIAAPGDRLRMRFRLPNPPAPRGSVIRAWISYYDVTEQWHRTEVLMTARRQEEQDHPLRIARTNVEETGRYLTPSQGSKRQSSLWIRALSKRPHLRQLKAPKADGGPGG
jgi:hypothetical protein